MIRFAFVLAVLVGTVWFAPTEAQAKTRLECRIVCGYKRICYRVPRCYVRRYCRPSNRCYWTRVCEPNAFGDEICEHRRVCRRTRRCSYRRYCYKYRRCRRKRRCYRRCRRVRVAPEPPVRNAPPPTAPPPRRRAYQQEVMHNDTGSSAGAKPGAPIRRTPPPSPGANAPAPTRTQPAPTRTQPAARRKPPVRRPGSSDTKWDPLFGVMGTTPGATPPGATPPRTRPPVARGAVPARPAGRRPAAPGSRPPAARPSGDLSSYWLNPLGALKSGKKPPVPRPQGGKAPNRPAAPSAAQRKRQEHLRALEAKLARRKAELERLRQLASEEQKRLRNLQRMSAKQKALAKRERELRQRLREQRQKELKMLRRQRTKEQKRLRRLQRLAAREQQLLARRKRLLELQRRAFAKRQKAALARLKKQEVALRSKVTNLRNQRRQISKTQNDTANAQASFNKGRLKEARQKFQKRKQGKMLALLNKFKSALREGRRAHQYRNPERAIPKLEQALMLDLELGGGRSVFTRQIRLMLANMYVSRGLMAMSRRNYSSAYLYFSVAHRYNPRHPSLKVNSKKLREIAKGYYKQALASKNKPDIARRYLQKVVRIVSPRDPLYRKARRELER